MPTTAELESAWRAGGGHLGKPNWTELRAAYGTAVGFPLQGYAGGGASYASESSAIFAAFTTPPTTARKSLIDAAVVALKSAGVWAKLDALYLFAAADAQAAKINWKQPGTYNCTETGTPIFTTDEGFTGGSPTALNTNFTPSTALTPNFTRDNACAFAWSNTSAAINQAILGDASGSGLVLIYPRWPTDSFMSHINQVSGNNEVPGITDGKGLYSVTRSSATLTDAYRNGVFGDADATPSIPVGTSPLTFMSSNVAYWTGQISAGGFGAHLNATEQLALYNALNTYLGGLYQAETNAIAAAFATPPTTARKSLIDAAVVALKSAGVWAKLDALYAFAAADSQAAKINWVQPGTYNATEVAAPAFEADGGFTGNGSSSYLSTGFNPATAPTPKFVQDSGAIFVWTNQSATTTVGVMGNSLATLRIIPKYTDTNCYCRVNSGTDIGAASPAAPDGLIVASRTGATASAAYRNGVSFATSAGASQTVSNAIIRVLNSADGFSAVQVKWAGIASGLTQADVTALYNALNTYLGGSYQAETNAIAAAFTTPPTTARKNLIDAAVVSLKSAGVWTKLDALYAFAAADSQAALINWKAPGTYNGTLVNAPTFTADTGFTGATTKYIDSNFNPTTASTPQFVQNSSSIFAWSTSVSADSILIGTSAATGTAGESYFLPWFVGGGNFFFARVSSSGDQTILNPVSTGLGFWVGARTGSTVTNFYRNGGASFLTSATASAAPANANLTIMHRGGQYSTGTIAGAGFGSGLSAAEQTALYNALRTYLTGVGVP